MLKRGLKSVVEPFRNKYPAQEINTGPYHVLDLETTGLSPHDSEIAEFAMLTCQGNTIIDVYHDFYQISKIDAQAAAVNGLSIYQLQGWPVFKSPQNLAKIKSKIKYKCFAHNSQFDKGFLVAAGAIPESWPFTDTKRLCMENGTKLENNKLITWCNHYGIRYEAHNALNDTFALWRLIVMKGWQIF